MKTTSQGPKVEVDRVAHRVGPLRGRRGAGGSEHKAAYVCFKMDAHVCVCLERVL